MIKSSGEKKEQVNGEKCFLQKNRKIWNREIGVPEVNNTVSKRRGRGRGRKRKDVARRLESVLSSEISRLIYEIEVNIDLIIDIVVSHIGLVYFYDEGE